MRTVKYTNDKDFKCLEDLAGTSAELSLIHMGRETCKPYHAFSGTKEEYVIHFVLSGCGLYSSQGNTWPLAQGQMFLIYPYDTVTYCSDRNNPWRYCWIGFRGSRAESVIKQCGFSKNQLILPAPGRDAVQNCFDEFFEHTTLSYSDTLYRESVLLKLLSLLSLHHSQLSLDGSLQQNPYDGNVYVRQAIDFINLKYMQNITVSDIAEHIGISRTHLNHVFQNEMRLSAQAFLMDFRMQKAISLVSNSSMSVKEIAVSIGYKDPLVFSKAFKRKFGLSPLQYRNHKIELETREKRP